MTKAGETEALTNIRDAEQRLSGALLYRLYRDENMSNSWLLWIASEGDFAALPYYSEGFFS